RSHCHRQVLRERVRHRRQRGQQRHHRVTQKVAERVLETTDRTRERLAQRLRRATELLVQLGQDQLLCPERVARVDQRLDLHLLVRRGRLETRHEGGARGRDAREETDLQRRTE